MPRTIRMRCSSDRRRRPSRNRVSPPTFPPCEEHTCPTCGHKSIEYRHTLNKDYTDALRKIARMCRNGNYVKLGDMGLHNSMYPNVQNLRFWGLTEPKFDEETQSRKAGYWRLTDLGRSFVEGVAKAHLYMYKRNKQLTRLCGPLLLIHEVPDKKARTKDFLDQAREQAHD